jgi:hypothetical protein
MVGCVEMKFIVFWEYRLEDMGKIIEKTKKLREDDEKNPGRARPMFSDLETRRKTNKI